MTKLPETISKRFNVLTGREVGTDELKSVGRGVGGSTAVAMSLLAEAQMTGTSFGFDFNNYETSKTQQGAAHLLSNLKELVSKLGFGGFRFKIMSLYDTRGLRGIKHDVLHQNYSHLPPGRSFGVVVWFDPIVEVHYDLRK